jgi:CarD family transcriptional regulator
MRFQIGDRVIYPAFGVGRIAAMVTKSFFEAESQLYYEVTGERSTVWVQVEEGTDRGLRRLSRPEDLAHYREVLRGRPADLDADARQRQVDQREKIRRGTLQDVCEVVRDLSGRGWRKPLNESDSGTLRRGSEALYQEWAAVSGVSVDEATTEVAGLLRQARQTYLA